MGVQVMIVEEMGRGREGRSQVNPSAASRARILAGVTPANLCAIILPFGSVVLWARWPGPVGS